MPAIMLSLSDRIFAAIKSSAETHKISPQQLIRNTLFGQFGPDTPKLKPQNAKRKAVVWQSQTFQFEVDPDTLANFRWFTYGRNERQKITAEYLEKGIQLVKDAPVELFNLSVSKRRFRGKWPRFGVYLSGDLLTKLDYEAAKLDCPMRTLAAAAFTLAMRKG